MKQCVIGIDVGTSGTKTIAVDQEGKILASALASYPLYTPQAGWNEQAPEDWWQAAAETLKKVTGQLEDTEIIGIGLSGQMHGMVALDRDISITGGPAAADVQIRPGGNVGQAMNRTCRAQRGKRATVGAMDTSLFHRISPPGLTK